MNIPIEREYASSGWGIERLAVLPDNWCELRVLRLVDGKLTYVAHERHGTDRFARAYAVHGDVVAGPYKHVERLAVEGGRMSFVAVDLYDVKGLRCGDAYYNGAYDPCGEIATADGEPLFTAITPKGNYVLVHGGSIIAHERHMIWGGAFAQGKKFYLTGKADLTGEGGEFQSVWGDERSCVYEHIGHVDVLDGVPTFGAVRRGYDFDVRGVNEKYTDRGFLARHLDGQPARIVRGEKGEAVSWKGHKDVFWDAIEQDSLGSVDGVLTYWASDQLGFDFAVVGKAKYAVPDCVTRYADRVVLANGLPLYSGSYRRTHSGRAEEYMPVIVCGDKMFERHSDVHQLEYADGKIKFLSVIGQEIVRISRVL